MIKFINKTSLIDEINFIQEGGMRTKGLIKKDVVNKPLFSIITVVKNSAHTLEKTINSVINQSYKNIEYIVINGASTDGTSEIINKYNNNIDYWCDIKDEGLYEAMNFGLIASTGSIIGIINSDDIYEYNAIEIVNSYFTNNRCSFVFGSVERNYIQNNKIIKTGYNINRIKYNFDSQTSHSSGFFIKKDAQKILGLYNTKYRCSADYDLFYRMIIHEKFRGESTSKNELIGIVASGGFSSKYGFWNHLNEETRIRLDNKQNKLLILVIYINAILKRYIKILFKKK
jgi:glycosyltransferase involved in cell wall biosynthesis